MFYRGQGHDASLCDYGVNNFWNVDQTLSNNILISISTQPKEGYRECYILYNEDNSTISKSKEGLKSWCLVQRTHKFLKREGFLAPNKPNIFGHSIKRLYIKIENQ